ncbi:unnamed protein product [Microthlaspi erraticum]|uniref:Fucosyltransferase n=1 Tax=Microthlaspi erraticum TaxID=1685480 RepID=A0A6D2IVF7_9BRAS|nr:unnamed protein product [Microthlaspi erraticum]
MSYLCLYLIHDYQDHDKMFFCEEDQNFIRQAPWLVFNANLYFIPSLWLIPSFHTELNKLFPQKDTVFHHLSRYLFHPTNQVWGMVTRSYNAYLSRADETLGIQVRVLSKPAGYFQHVMDQILACTQREKLLPEVATPQSPKVTNISRSLKLKAVLVTSLYPEYSEKLRTMYWESPSSTEEMLQVYQPSQEMYQQTDKRLHDQKALAEMYLLSLTDKLVTSDSSTFGYVAQGLGGLKPWILYKPKNHTAPNPPCVRAMSMEPCFLRAPLYGCQAKTVNITPFVRRCEDRLTGLKLVDSADEFLLEDNISFGISGMIKLTITIPTSLAICSVLLLSSSNIFNRHKSHLTTTGSTDSKKLREKLPGGLLAAEFDEESCLSRYHQSSLRKPPPYKPSGSLVSKLRSYEMLHKRCGPGTDAYKRATEQLRHNDHITSSGAECQYVVWTPMFGLGNRILSMVSAFLYALLTERVLLLDPRNDITDLFCEPFPGTSWLLPLHSPLTDQIDSFNREHSHCYGTMLNNHAINSTTTPSHLYIDIFHDSRDHDKLFFCEKEQAFLKNVPWLVVKSNLYYLPALWLVPSFQTELIKLFPQKDTVFHHLSQYLLHPTNQVWGMVTRSYNAYLARADERLGIQVRVFSTPAGYFQHVMDQIVSCTQREKLLPELATIESQLVNTSEIQKLKAVLVTSLFPEYSNELSNMFWERATSTGEIIKVYQPSGEKIQQSEKKPHDQKALAEIYLLSLTDKLVTSTRSTFGYVAQGLGGLKPWILYEPRNSTVPDPPCVRAMSMEPCSLKAPLSPCQAQTIKISPFVRYCEDRVTGIKLVDDD